MKRSAEHSGASAAAGDLCSLGKKAVHWRGSRTASFCGQAWRMDERGLRAIQSTYRDLYVTAPDVGERTADQLKEDAPEYRAEADGQEASP